MDIEQLLVQSLQLLGLGMGAVFIILALLILLISLVSKVVPEEAARAAPAPAAATGIDRDHIAAIAAALHRYKKRR